MNLVKKIEKILKNGGIEEYKQEADLIIQEISGLDKEKLLICDDIPNADKIEEIRLQNRLRQQKYRENMKSEKEKSNVTVTQRNTKEEKKIRNKIEKEGDENRSGFKEFKL